MAGIDLEELARRIDRDRRVAGVTLEQLAAGARVARSTIGRILAGEVRPFPETLQRIARVIGTEVEGYLSLAGYYDLPDLPVYLRTKYGVSDLTARDVTTYLEYRLQHENESTDQAA